MRRQMNRKIYILIFIVFNSCKPQTEFKKNDSSESDFLKSKSFHKAKNQFGKLVDFNFEIDTLTKIKYDKTE